MIGSGAHLPYQAFVSGPEMKFRVEFNDYDADVHRGIVPHALMEFIRRRADQILVVGEVWFREEDAPTRHGVMILDARPDGDTLYEAEFEGKTTLKPWKANQPGPGGNLSELFKRAEESAA